MTQIREAAKKDLQELVFFHRRLYLDHREAISPQGLDRFFEYVDFQNVLKSDMDAMLRSATTKVLVAEENGGLLGYITGTLKEAKGQVLVRRGVVGDWFVSEEARGQGVGKQLVATLLTWFEEKGCCAVESSTWAFNDSGRRAHESLGFKEAKVSYYLDLSSSED